MSKHAAKVRDWSAREAVLLAQQEKFLRFLRRRLGSEQLAREVFQSAWLKALEKQETIRDDGSAVAWFYRLLRNAAVDVQRSALRDGRIMDRTQTAFEAAQEPELHRAVCHCVHDVLRNLKPDYARLLERVDLEGASVPEAAREESITPNNAAVRLHRARRALRHELEALCGACAKHSCLECDCRKRPV